MLCADKKVFEIWDIGAVRNGCTLSSALGMDNTLAVKVHYRLGSRNR